jgi:signal recognition particle receptor subunit beta
VAADPLPLPTVATATAKRARSRVAAAPSAALLAGPTGAGKTTLFHALTTGAPPSLGTTPSMVENAGVANIGPRSIPLVDTPGHPRLRALAASRAPSAKCIVFAVDAADFLPRKADAADAFAALLAPAAAARRRLPVLLLAHKADTGASAHTAEFVRRRLEKEIDAALATASTLADDAGRGGGGGSTIAALARGGAPFTFAGLAAAGGPRVQCAAGAARVGDVAAVSDFLAKHG